MSPAPDVIFNHDGFGLLSLLAGTDLSEKAAAEALVLPLVKCGVSVIDWSILSTAHHNCRTRYDFGFSGPGAGRRIDELIGRVISHYNAADLDLLDIVVKHGHAHGAGVWGSLRLNHSSLEARLFERVPGRNFQDGVTLKKDFRDEVFHGYLCDLVEDMLAKGVDGIVLDWERKAPFFAPEVPLQERLAAGRHFLRRVRALTGKPLAVRAAHESAKGQPQGQDIEGWLSEGLLDVIIPATHNHEPDDLSWSIQPFVQAAGASPRPCRVWPQIWPTGIKWAAEGTGDKVRHGASAVRERSQALVDQGADGVYFFNFCCDGWPAPPDLNQADYSDIFQDIPGDAARSEAIFGGLRGMLSAASRR